MSTPIEDALRQQLRAAPPEPIREIRAESIFELAERRSGRTVTSAVAGIAIVLVLITAGLVCGQLGRKSGTTKEPAASTATRSPSVSEAELYASSWQLQSIIGPGGRSATPPTVPSSLVFDQSGTVSSSICAVATAHIEPGVLTFEQNFVTVTVTGTDCPPSLSTVEARFVYGAVLIGTDAWSIEGQKLTISKPGVGSVIYVKS